jgi:hypothetical protein
VRSDFSGGGGLAFQYFLHDPYTCPYSPECVEGVFSEIYIHDAASNLREASQAGLCDISEAEGRPQDLAATNNYAARRMVRLRILTAGGAEIFEPSKT